MNDPQLQVRFFAALRSRLAISHAALFRNLHLSEPQIAAFEDAIIQHDEQVLDIRSVASDPSIGVRVDRNPVTWEPLKILYQSPSNSPDVNPSVQLLANADATLQQAINSIAGAEGYSQYQAYERSLDLRDFANTVNSQLSVSASALTSDQVDQLIQQMSDSVLNSPTSGTRAIPMESVDWSRVLAVAQSTLTPDQYQTLQRSVQPQQALAQIITVIRKSNRGGP